MSASPEGPSRPPAAGAHGVLKSIGRSCTDLYVPLRDWLAGIEASTAALKVGDEAPDFFLPDESARLISLASLLLKGPVVLDFLCGSWSSPCLSMLLTLDIAIRKRATLVAITAETGRYPRAMKAQNKLTCAVLSDVDYGVELKFGLINAVPSVIVTQMAVRGVDLAIMHGTAKPMLAVPSTYVIAPSGKITYAKVDLDFSTPPDITSIVGALTNS